MSVASLFACPDCGHLVSRLAMVCPSCARPFRAVPRSGRNPVVFSIGIFAATGVGLVIALVVGLFLLGAIGILGEAVGTAIKFYFG